MSLLDITNQIKNRVSIFGIYNSASKQKEVILNFENQIQVLQNELKEEKNKNDQIMYTQKKQKKMIEKLQRAEGKTVGHQEASFKTGLVMGKHNSAVQ